MNNPVPYSPFNRTYKFISMQNQKSHYKNLREMRRAIDTNVMVSRSLSKENLTEQNHRRNKTASQSSSSFYLDNSVQLQSTSKSMVGFLRKKPIKIHKNSKLQKYRNFSIYEQNQRLSKAIIQSSCEIPKIQKTENDYKKSITYRNIAMRYDQNTNRNKQLLAFSQRDRPSAISTIINSNLNTKRIFYKTNPSRVKQFRENYRTMDS